MEVTTNNVPLKVEATNGPDRSAKKSAKEEKSRRKDDKSVEQVMKALNVLETTEEKLAAMCKKYTEIVDENRKLQLTAKQWEKGLNTVQREKEQLQADHSKAVLTRSRLESLCRELQRQNKQVKEESLLKIREEEEKRKEVSAKFNTTLAEITSLMSSSNEKTNKLRDENVEITKRFKSICDQSAIQQQQVDKMNTQRKLEAELTEARLTKQRLEFTAEKEILLKEKQELFLEIQSHCVRISELEASETSLKGQVALYADRYDEFQTALTKSNEVFGGFKGEMEKMSKKITRLEKETFTWKSRWEKSHQALLEMAADKTKSDGELALANRKHTQLEKLCRTLQNERVLLLGQIKSSNQTPSTNNGSVEATTADVEDTLRGVAVENVDNTAKATAESLKLVADENSSEKVDLYIKSPNIEPTNGDNNSGTSLIGISGEGTASDATLEQTPSDDLHSSFTSVVNTMEKTSIGDGGSLEKSPVLYSDVAKHEAGVNADNVVKTTVIHVDGDSNSSNTALKLNVGNDASRGDKVSDIPSVPTNNVESTNEVKNIPGENVRKNKPVFANDAKKDKVGPKSASKTAIDTSKDKKAKELGINKPKVESSSEKKEKKNKEIAEKREKKDKVAINPSNEKEKDDKTDLKDTKKVIVDSLNKEKKDEAKVQGSSEMVVLAKESEAEKKVQSVASPSQTPGGEAKYEVELKDFNKVVVDSLSNEKKDVAKLGLSESIVPANKPKEGGKIQSLAPTTLPSFSVEVNKIGDKNKVELKDLTEAVVDSSNEEKKDDVKEHGVAENTTVPAVEKKAKALEPTNKSSSPSKELNKTEEIDKVESQDSNKPAVDSPSEEQKDEVKLPVVNLSETTTVPAKEPGVDMKAKPMGSTSKIPLSPSKDVKKKIPKPEKIKKLEKAPVNGAKVETTVITAEQTTIEAADSCGASKTDLNLEPSVASKPTVTCEQSPPTSRPTSVEMEAGPNPSIVAEAPTVEAVPKEDEVKPPKSDVVDSEVKPVTRDPIDTKKEKVVVKKRKK